MKDKAVYKPIISRELASVIKFLALGGEVPIWSVESKPNVTTLRRTNKGYELGERGASRPVYAAQYTHLLFDRNLLPDIERQIIEHGQRLLHEDPAVLGTLRVVERIDIKEVFVYHN